MGKIYELFRKMLVSLLLLLFRQPIISHTNVGVIYIVLRANILQFVLRVKKQLKSKGAILVYHKTVVRVTMSSKLFFWPVASPSNPHLLSVRLEEYNFL